MDYEDIIKSLKEQLAYEIKLSAMNKEYMVFLEKKIENLEKINSMNLKKINHLEEKLKYYEE